MEIKTRIEYDSKSDDQGRCSFTLFWNTDDPERPHRAQCFRADPRTYGHPRPEEAK